jgi:hypothetical protein
MCTWRLIAKNGGFRPGQEYMEAAGQLLAGPFALCRLQAKVDRWRDAIAPFMAADTAAGLYPAKAGQRFDWEASVREFRDTVLPFHFDKFRAAVSCERDYPWRYRAGDGMEDVQNGGRARGARGSSVTPFTFLSDHRSTSGDY